MNNKKNTKRALLASTLALILCFSMLLGTTYAWFTDSAASGTNVITTGNLDAVLEYKTDWNDEWAPVTADTLLFNDEALYEPGFTEVAYLRVSNAGSLAFKYNLMFNLTNEVPATNVYGETFKLSDYLVFGSYVQDEYNGEWNYADILMPTMFGTAEAALNNAHVATLSKVDPRIGTNRPVLAGDKTAQVWALVLSMPTTVGNEANTMPGTAAPSFDFSVSMLATQYTSEQDSFGSSYDANAELPAAVATATELAEALTANKENIEVTLVNDVDLPITSLGNQTGGSGEYKLGGENTESIVINLNGHKLNVTTTYWSNLGAKNPNATFTIKNGVMTSSQATGTWNSYDLCFSNCNYVFENVTFDKAVALESAGKSVKMNNVTINETHDYYALWISAKGQNIEIDGLTINSDGRGIKIDEQYVNAPAKVTLSITDAVFNTAKKAAIVVKSAAGADITLDNVSIANVATDPFNAVWVDEDAATYANLVTVTGGTVVVEGSADVPVMANPSNVQSCINNAVEGATVVLTKGTYENTIVMKSNITLLGTDGAVVYGVNLNGADNVTIKNVTFDAAGAKPAYDGGAKFKQYANIFTGDNTNNPNKGSHNLVIDGCTFTGTFAKGGAAIAFCDQTRKGGGSGNVTIKNCTFDTVGGYYDIYGHYTGAGLNGFGDFIIENNTFATEELVAGHIYLGRYASSTPVVVTGNTFENVASIDVAMGIQDHSDYGVSINATNNTFKG